MTDVILAVVLFVALLLAYLHILELIFGIRKDLTQQSHTIESAVNSLKESARQMNLAEKPLALELDNDVTIYDWLRKVEHLTPRSIYPESCNSDGSFNTVINVIRASDMTATTPRSDVSLEDFWRTSELGDSAC